MTLPPSSVISAVRRSHSFSSYGFVFALLNTRSTLTPFRFLPLARPPRLGVATLGLVERRGAREVGTVEESLVSIMGCFSRLGCNAQKPHSKVIFGANHLRKLGRAGQRTECYHNL